MKTLLKTLLIIVSVAGLVGCGSISDISGINNGSESNKDNPTASGDAVSAEYDTAVEFYNRFINNEIEFSIEEENYLISTGKYNLVSLKKALLESDGKDFYPSYRIIDVTEDNETVPILILRMNVSDSAFTNTVFLIKYENDKLINTYVYSDGYRTYSYVWDNGYLEIGGSSGAGLFGYDFLKIKKDGTCERLFSHNTVSGMWVNQIEYDLGLDYEKITDYNTVDSFELTVQELICDDKVYICVDEYSKDPATKKLEEDYIEKVKGLGAEVISDVDFENKIKEIRNGNDMASEHLIQDEYEIVQSKEIYPIASNNGELFTGRFVPSEELSVFNYPTYSEDPDKSQLTALMFNETVFDVSYVNLYLKDNYSKDDPSKLDYYVMWDDSCIGVDEEILIGVVFDGDVPTKGIVLTDGLGNKHLYALELSGMDGSLLITEFGVGDELFERKY